MTRSSTNALTYACATAVVLYGTPLGSVAFYKALANNNAFFAFCDPDEVARHQRHFHRHGTDPNGLCHAQQVLLAQVFALVPVVGGIISLPVGWLVDRFGPYNLARAMLVLHAAGYAVCGLDLAHGLFFALGMVTVALSGSAGYTIACGAIIPLATKNDSNARDRWIGYASVAVSVGYACAIPFGMLLEHPALRIWAWFAVAGAVLATLFLVWHQFAVMPFATESVEEEVVEEEEVDAAREPIEDPQSPQLVPEKIPLSSFFANWRLYLCVAQFACALVVVGSIESATGTIAPWFGLSTHVTLVVPLVIAVSSLVYFVLSTAGIAQDHFQMLVFRMVCVVGFSFGLAYNDRSPFTFWLAITAAGAWRAAALVVPQIVCIEIGGVNRGLLIGALVTLSSLVSVPSAQLLTFTMGASPMSLTQSMGAVGALIVAVDLASYYLLVEPIISRRQEGDRTSKQPGVAATERTALLDK